MHKQKKGCFWKVEIEVHGTLNFKRSTPENTDITKHSVEGIFVQEETYCVFQIYNN